MARARTYRHYSPEEKAGVVARIRNGATLREAAAPLGASSSRALDWRRQLAPDLERAEQKPEYVALLSEQLIAAIQEIGRKLAEGGLRDVAVATGILSDKLLDHRDGRRGMQLNVDARRQVIQIGADTPDEVMEYLLAQAGLPALDAPD